MRPEIAELPKAEVIDVGALAAAYAAGEVDLICVLGPTASGKTRYAVSLARQIGDCEIISADSRQVYRGMDIGTGKDLAEYGEIPYHLIDILPAGEKYNVYRFQQDFLAAYQDIRKRGRIPILCGGTGLYITAVTCAYDWTESVPLSKRKELAGGANGTTADPGAHGDLSPKGLPQRPFFIGTLVTREERNARIDRRLDERLAGGMVEEIRGLLESGVPAATLLSYGLEYRYVTLYLQGELSYEEMRARLAIAIHQFAKRQMTWCRGMERGGIRIHWTNV
ncbi:MAG: tRNA dimethylallyltransferase [Bacteroidales bacterium]|nr:tRNA dimethylallyltransferase [Bacteroidales bacterium]